MFPSALHSMGSGRMASPSAAACGGEEFVEDGRAVEQMRRPGWMELRMPLHAEHVVAAFGRIASITRRRHRAST